MIETFRKRKFRIVKLYYSDNKPYYIVQQKKIFWWGVPDHAELHEFRFAVTTSFIYYKQFKTVEEAEYYVNIAKLSYELKDEVIKEL